MTTKQTKSLTIIKRSSPPCPMCEMLTRGLDGIGAEYTAIDIADNPEVVAEYDVSTIPVTLIKDEQGDVVERFDGMVAPQMLADIIKEGR